MANRIVRLVVKESADPLVGEFSIPSSKYHAHRALMLASLAPGRSVIQGLSDAGHVRHTIGALRALGTKIRIERGTFVVDGGPYHPLTNEISVGSSGTTLYFLTGLASLADAPVTITGQRYFQRRPISPLLDALRGLGVELSTRAGCPPIGVAPRRPAGGHVTIAGTLSQWISGLLLLAPFASGPSTIVVEDPFNERSYVELTIAMMTRFGLHVEVLDTWHRFEIEPGQVPHPATVALPPDVGAAAFGLAATALHPSDVVFRGLRALSGTETDHPEAELLDIVSAMGLPMEREPDTGEVRVRHDGINLSPVDVDCAKVPDMLPILSVLGTFARGTTTLGHVEHVRLKESDRVSAMLQLNRMGGRLEVQGDRLVCHGVDHLTGADLSSFNDHRVLMALSIAATRAEGETRLTYPHAYRISYPRFLHEMGGVGMSLSVESATREPAGRAATTAIREATPPSRAATPATRGVTSTTREAPRTVRVRPATADAVMARDAAIPIDEYVRRWAAERPDDLAVVEVGRAASSDQSMTWRELDRRVDAAAAFLLELGVAPGEAVAYQLPNWGLFTVLTLAVLRIGAVCCPVMPIFRGRELGFVLRRSGARVLVVPRRFRGRDHAREVASLSASPAGEGLTLAHVVVAGDQPADAPPAGAGDGPVRWHELVDPPASEDLAVPDLTALPPRARSSKRIAQLLYTSGTSGEPKGVLHRMDTLTRAAAMEVRHLGLGATDRVFVPSPLAHQTGFLYGMWLALHLGVPQILQPVWDGPRALATMRRWDATFVQAATPFLADLVRASEERGEHPEALRVFVVTGAAVPRGLAEHATRALGAAVCGAWGTTETCLGSLGAPGDEPSTTWGTDGRALEGVRLRIVDEHDEVLAAGEEGNLEVRSACLFEGYLDRPDLTAEAMTPDGWYRTGDLAVIDEAGYLRLRGRTKDVINRGGEKVPVGEIEQLLYLHPAVDDVAIVAMPDDRLGERACAFVVAAPEFDLAEMQRYLDEREVVKQYWPERLEPVDSLPRNPAGKVQKYVLRERARELPGRER